MKKYKSKKEDLRSKTNDKRRPPNSEYRIKDAVRSIHNLQHVDLSEEEMNIQELFLKYLSSKKCFDKVVLLKKGVRKVRCENGKWGFVRLFVPLKHTYEFKIGYHRIRPPVKPNVDFVIFSLYFEGKFVSYVFSAKQIPKVQSLVVRFNYFGRKNKYGYGLENWGLLNK